MTINQQCARIAKQFQVLAQAVPALMQGIRKAQVVAQTNGHGKITPSGRKAPTLSPAIRAALRQQGQYMGGMRGLPKMKQAQVKRIRKEKGIRAAIAAIRRMK